MGVICRCGERGIRTPGPAIAGQRFSRPPHSTTLPSLPIYVTKTYRLRSLSRPGVTISPVKGRQARNLLNAGSCIFHPASFTLHPAPCTLHPASCTLHLAPCTLQTQPSKIIKIHGFKPLQENMLQSLFKATLDKKNR
jgi:hypothetical protein